MQKILLISLLCVIGFGVTFAADANAWRSRSIYQVLTDRFAKTDGSQGGCDLHNYCGGTFVGIKNKLDYIASMGFDAIWISPIVKNLDGGYHGYWATDLYQINSNFGSAQDLKDLISAAHAKGMYVMVDVVGNHVGPVGMDFSKINPFNDASHYHDRCQITDWNNQQQVEYCRLADLPDLNQDNPYVRKTLCDWIKNLVAEYQIDGIRIDTIPEVHGDFWADFGKAAGVYQVGEVFNGDYGYVGNYQNYIDALLNYPLYYQIKNQFGGHSSMYNFRSYYQNMDSHFKNQDVLGVFVDNHDNARYLNQYNDKRNFKSALAFALSVRGIPITYYGSEQAFNGGGDPYNREPLWNSGYARTDIVDFLKTINQARKETQWYNQPQIERYIDDSFYSFSRGTTLFAFTNQPDQQQTRTITYHPYSEGQTICNIFNGQDCLKVQNKQFTVSLSNGEVKIYVPKASFLEEQMKLMK